MKLKKHCYLQKIDRDYLYDISRTGEIAKHASLKILHL
jgi:hypothetical protein